LWIWISSMRQEVIFIFAKFVVSLFTYKLVASLEVGLFSRSLEVC
jgi:hypothetical protein